MDILKKFKVAVKSIICLLMLVIPLTVVNAEVNKITDYRKFSDWAKYLEMKYQFAFYETEYSSHYPSFAKNDPAMNIRKWEVANIIYELKEEEYEKVTIGSMKFADEVYISAEGPISLSDDQIVRVNKLHKKGIIPDNGNGLFGVFDEVEYKELTKWLDSAKFPVEQLDEKLEIQISATDKVTVEQFLAILDIVAPNSLEIIQTAFMDTYTRNWVKFQNVCTLHDDKDLHTLKVQTNAENIDRTTYYPFNSWAVDTGKKYELIFTENNTRATTRGEFANLLYYLIDVSDSGGNNEFNDLYTVDDSLRIKINSIAEKNIISGYEDGTFRPNASVTRAEFVSMLERTKMFDNSPKTSSCVFYDIENHWAKENIKKISEIGLMTGKGNNEFRPDDNVTPQEILVILDRMVTMKYIDKQELLNSMQNTFSCKKYDDTDKYVIEVLYSEFDQVQNDIKHSWPYNYWKTYYAWEDWNSTATYNDLLYALYFASTGNTSVSDENLLAFEREILQEGINASSDKKPIITALKGNTNPASWRDVLYAMYVKSGCGNLDNFKDSAKEKGYFNELMFSNVKQLPDCDNAVLWALSYDYADILKNNEMYFNINGALTKYMLNYMVLKCQNISGPLRNEFGKSSETKSFFASLANPQDSSLSRYNNYGIETDESKLPSNYKNFPYIVKGVPKEVYEIDGIRQICSKDYQPGDNLDADTIYCNPLMCYSGFSKEYGSLIENTYAYYDLILNVDYRTMDIEKFVADVSTYAYPNSDLAEKYAQYVIDNKIILKGKGCAIPGTKSIAGWLGYVRVMIEFEIISAEENVDILFGDFVNRNMGYYDRYAPEHIPVTYASNKYFLYFDQLISGTFMFANKEYIGVSYYRVIPDAIVRYIYMNDDSVNTLY